MPTRRAPSPSALRAGLTPIAAASILLSLAPPAQAQQVTKEATTVVITGIRRSIEDSISAKRNSDSIIEAVSAEDIGKLPDASIAESLARLPGLTGQRGPDGRVNVISIRGLSPEFAGALLNGREVVSSNDSRAVEYDQFPSELIGQAIVYKTPNAALIGQGLSGTLDLRSRRSLDTRGREISVNLRGDRNSNGTLVPGVAPSTGSRFSLAYVDQFANNTIGVALGFARLDAVTNMKLTELVHYGDPSPWGYPDLGQPASANEYEPGKLGRAAMPMFWTATSSTKRNLRDGYMAVLEYKPNKDFRSQLDLYHSRFDTHEVGGKLLHNLWAGWDQFYGLGVRNSLSDIALTQSGGNTLITSATAAALPVFTGNFDTKRKDRINALGWNNAYSISDRWKVTADLNYSKDVRDETYSEVYGGPWDRANNRELYSPMRWNIPVDGSAQTVTPQQPGVLADASNFRLGPVTGFNWVPGQPLWAGAVRFPHIDDEIKAIRLAGERYFDGIISSVQFGLNHTTRDKTVEKNESRILMPRDAAGNIVRDVPAGSVRSPHDMSWAGAPQLIRIDVPSLVNGGGLDLQLGRFTNKVDNDSSVSEKVTTAFAMANFDTKLAQVPLRGNFGVQFVQTRQRSEGWEYRGNDDVPDETLLTKRTGGASYTEVLPSMNIVATIRPALIARFGLGMTTARPNIVDMRAGTSTPTLITGDGPDQGKWTTAYAGNPELKPWRASNIDLSLEKYFGKRSYVAAALFRKNLLSYVTYGTGARDNSDLPLPANLPPGIVVQKFGPTFQPLNGTGGYIEGLELAASLEASLLSPALEGFGVVLSASKLNSSIRDQKVNPDTGRVIAGESVPLNGMSGISNNVTVYYENHGFSARVSQRYRSAFTATTRDIYLNSTTRRQAADKIVDLQLGYNFSDQGMLKGLSLLLQVNNALDKKAMNLKIDTGLNLPDTTQLYPNYTYQFGRQVLFGANYKF